MFDVGGSSSNREINFDVPRVQADELSIAAAARFRQVQKPPTAVAWQSTHLGSDGFPCCHLLAVALCAVDAEVPSQPENLQAYERSVHKALEKLLAERFRLKPPVPAVVAFHPTPYCDARLAVPRWELAVEVGLRGDLFEGPREAWADAGWGRTAENELDHGPIPGDFIATGPDEALEDAQQRWFNMDTMEESPHSLDTAGNKVQWQPLPALRIRLLRASGWKVLEIPYYEWRKLAKSEQQRFLGQRLKDLFPPSPTQRALKLGLRCCEMADS